MLDCGDQILKHRSVEGTAASLDVTSSERPGVAVDVQNRSTIIFPWVDSELQLGVRNRRGSRIERCDHRCRLVGHLRQARRIHAWWACTISNPEDRLARPVGLAAGGGSVTTVPFGIRILTFRVSCTRGAYDNTGERRYRNLMPGERNTIKVICRLIATQASGISKEHNGTAPVLGGDGLRTRARERATVRMPPTDVGRHEHPRGRSRHLDRLAHPPMTSGSAGLSVRHARMSRCCTSGFQPGTPHARPAPGCPPAGLAAAGASVTAHPFGIIVLKCDLIVGGWRRRGCRAAVGAVLIDGSRGCLAVDSEPGARRLRARDRRKADRAWRRYTPLCPLPRNGHQQARRPPPSATCSTATPGSRQASNQPDHKPDHAMPLTLGE